MKQNFFCNDDAGWGWGQPSSDCSENSFSSFMTCPLPPMSELTSRFNSTLKKRIFYDNFMLLSPSPNYVGVDEQVTTLIMIPRKCSRWLHVVACYRQCRSGAAGFLVILRISKRGPKSHVFIVLTTTRMNGELW